MTQDKSSHFKMFLKVMLTKVDLLNKIMTVLRLMKISLHYSFNFLKSCYLLNVLKNQESLNFF